MLHLMKDAGDAHFFFCASLLFYVEAMVEGESIVSGFVRDELLKSRRFFYSSFSSSPGQYLCSAFIQHDVLRCHDLFLRL